MADYFAICSNDQWCGGFTHPPSRLLGQPVAAKFITLNTKFIVLDTQLLDFDTPFFVFNTKFIISTHRSPAPTRHGRCSRTSTRTRRRCAKFRLNE